MDRISDTLGTAFTPQLSPLDVEHCHPQELTSAAPIQVGVPLEQPSESSSPRPFVLLLGPWCPSCVQDNITRIQAATLQQINLLLVSSAGRFSSY